MFERIRLKNFKAWRDTGDVDLKPVTLLLGTNSSGKSSLIQSILMLKQTERSPDRTVHLNLGGDEQNDLFNFGEFDDVLKKGEQGDRQFSIRLDFKAENENDAFFECKYQQDSSRATVIADWTLGTESKVFQSIRRDKGAYSIVLDRNISNPVCKGRQYSPERSVSLSAEAISELKSEGSLVEDLSLQLRTALRDISYLGPLRRKPERDYVWNKTLPGAIETDGHRAIDVLLANSQLKSDDQNRIVDGVSKWLSRMGVADKLEVKQVGRSSRFEVAITKNGVESNIRDVGIGVSQVLPVLVVSLFAKKGATIILEEPEIHLHPLAQSLLAEVFVEESQNRNIQFLVETHSEHLFRRMQTLIARRSYGNDKVAMYFVDNSQGSAALNKLKINEFGKVSNWPKNFFGDALGETREQTKLAIQHSKELREMDKNVSN
ncbi:AAA family ATPase [Teredinibacter turnerae]|uniref:AAA family ATPase n=1 Tax=Teredinibacter turnerae TaxID=2426 RepID=UPI0030D35E4E